MSTKFTFIRFFFILSFFISIFHAKGQAPSNDDCLGAISLTVGTTCNSVPGNVTNATESMNGCAGNANDDVWYKFVADEANTKITVTGSSGFDAVIELFSGSCAELSSVTCHDVSGSGGTEVLTSTLSIGSTYYIRVYDYSSATSTADFSICVTGIPALANDDCAGAVSITLGTECSPVDGSLLTATETLAANCYGTADDDVWYKFEATSTNPAISVSGSSGLDVVVEIFDGTCPSGSSLFCIDQSGSGGTETIFTNNLTINNTYYVRVYSYYSSVPSSTEFTICGYNPPAPANDDCAGAVLLNVGSSCSSISGDVTGAGQTLTGCTGTADDDVWYKFVATGASPVIKVSGSSYFNAVIEVFEESCSSESSLFCSNNADTGEDEIINTSELEVGKTYYVRVYHSSENAPQTRTFDICIYNPAIPSNDNCAGAITVPVGKSCNNITGNILGSTESLSGCSGTANDDVWYKFTATATSITVKVDGGSDFDPVIELFNSSCSTGSSVLCTNLRSEGNPEIMIASGLTVGNTYYVRVYDSKSVFPVNTEFSFCVYETPDAPVNDNCDGAISLNVSNSCVLNAGTLETTSPSSFGGCSGDADDDVWYKFVAAKSDVEIKVMPSNAFDAVVELRAGTCTSGSSLYCRDNSLLGGTETISATGLVVGGTYYIRVFSYYTYIPYDPTFTICVFNSEVPDNDECADAIELIPNAKNHPCSPVYVNTTLATQSTQTSSCTSFSIDDDIWYHFTATSSKITLTGKNLVDIYGIGVTLYEGSCTGTELECDIDISGDSIVFDNLISGKKYYLRLFSYMEDKGSFEFCLKSDVISAIQNKEIGNNLILYPNPTAGIAEIEFKDNSSAAIAKLISVEGEVLWERSLFSNNGSFNEKINLSAYPEGIYLLQIISNNGVATQRVVITK